MIGYISLKIFINLFRVIPFPVLYIFSDLMRFIFYYVIRYRKRVAFDNLRHAFPEKSEREIRKIAWASYRNLTDIMLESFKGMVTSSNELKRRFKILNPEIANEYIGKDKSVIFLMGHNANWEWSMTTDEQFEQDIVAVYKPLRNKKLNRYMKENRERFGSTLIPIKDTRTAFSDPERKIGLVLIADQSPNSLRNAIWVDFFNRDTPCIHGPEGYAKKLDLPIIFVEIRRLKRGYYETELFSLVENPKDFEPNEITQLYMSRLEEFIKMYPETWVWTHKRWKHKRINGEIIRDYYYPKKK